MARDAYVSWQASRYSVPWQYVGQEVWVRERGSRCGSALRRTADRGAWPGRAPPPGHHPCPNITKAFHWAHSRSGKILIQMRETAPSVEVRSLAAYESAAMGGAR